MVTGADLTDLTVPLHGLAPQLNDRGVKTFGEMIGDAQVVAIGEATHGTSEFHLLRHRLVQHLVERHAFRAIGLEAGWAECFALDRHVMDGVGDAAHAVAATGYWMWDVWEFRECIEWLRQHNAARPREERVRIFGCDAPSGRGASALAQSILESVDPELGREFTSFWPRAEAMTPFERLAPEERDVFAVDLARLQHAVNMRASRHHPAIADDQWQTVQHALVVLGQVHARRVASDSVASWSARDAAMASNVMWELDSASGTCRTVVLAHNGHVARDARGMFDPSAVTLGQHLADSLGEAFVSVGLVFGQGAFQAIVDADIGSPRLDEVQVGEPPEGSLDSLILDACPGPGLLLDMRVLPPSIRDHLDTTLVIREVGAGWEGESAMHTRIHPASRHDVLAFVRRTTRAHPTPTGMRPPW